MFTASIFVALFERADIDRENIKTAEMSWAGWITSHYYRNFDRNMKIVVPMVDVEDTGEFDP